MSLLAHYKLDNNAEDCSGNGYHGTPYNMSWADGKIGRCGSFNGTSWIDLHNLGNSKQGSISFWYKKNTTATEYLFDGRGTGNWWFLTYYSGYDINFYGLGYNGMALGQWHHVVVTANSTQRQMFINGQLVATGSGLEIDFRSVRIGTRYTNSAYLVGNIDDARFYNHVLTQKEITELSRAKILHYKFDDFQEPTENILPNANANGRFTIENGWGTYNVNQYNGNTYFSIGTIGSVSDNIVTLSSVNHVIRTYDALRPQTTGGGVTAGTIYFIKKINDTQFSLHTYNSSQNGSQGYINTATGLHKVYDSIGLDQRISISASGFPTMWHGPAHIPNTAHVKEIVENGGYFINTPCMRIHVTRTIGVDGGMAYGVYTPVNLGDKITVSYWVRASSQAGIGVTHSYGSYFGSGFASKSGSIVLTENWQKMELSWISSNTISFYQYFYFPASSAPYSADMADLQVEKKSYATPFTPNTRLGQIIDYAGNLPDTVLDIATTPRWTEDSKVGSGCYEFDGATTNAVIPNTNKYLSPHLGDFSICFWMKSSSTANERIFSRGSYLNDFEIWKTSGIRATIADGTTRIYSTGSINIADNVWHHVAVIYNRSGNSVVYIDAVADPAGTNNISSMASIDLDPPNIYLGSYGTSGSYRYTGLLDDIKFFATALSESDIKELFQTRASLDVNGDFHTICAKEYHNWSDDIGNFNLIENGDQEYENNYNFTSFSYDSSLNCLSKTSGSSSGSQDLFIPVLGNQLDSFDQYRLEGQIMGVDYESRYYFMISCYDKHFRFINHYDVAGRSNTETTLAQDLNNGDEWVYLADATNWYDDGTTNYNHNKGLALWHPTEDTEPYVTYKYTRRWQQITEVDKINNRVRINGTYSGITIPAGSPARNNYSGGTYSYIAASNQLTDLNDWVFKSAETSITDNIGSMRYGSAYIKVGFLINRNAVGGTPTTLVKNLRFYNLSSFQKIDSEFYTPQLKSSGVYLHKEFSETGPMQDLIAWWPLNGNADDYSGYGNHGTVNGAVVSSGVNGRMAYLFDGIDDYISIGYNFPDMVGNMPYTLSAWIYLTANTGDTTSGSSVVGHASSTGFGLQIMNNKVNFGYRNRSNFYSNTVLALNTWYHIVGVGRDGDNNYIFINGALDATYNHTTYIDIASTSAEVQIGWADSRITTPFPGKIQDVRIYKKALTPSEINILYSVTGNAETRMKQTKDCLYLKGQLKEV